MYKVNIYFKIWNNFLVQRIEKCRFKCYFILSSNFIADLFRCPNSLSTS